MCRSGVLMKYSGSQSAKQSTRLVVDRKVLLEEVAVVNPFKFRVLLQVFANELAQTGSGSIFSLYLRRI